MKITISPSQDQSIEKFPYFSVTIEHPEDEITTERLVKMFYSAMVGWGFDKELASKALQNFKQ